METTRALYILPIVLCLLAQSTWVLAEKNSSRDELGVTATGICGVNRMTAPVCTPFTLRLSAQGGYGFIESIEDEDGIHNRLIGSFGVGGTLIPQLSFGLSVDGRYDFHPEDARGKDTSAVGDPRFVVQGGFSPKPNVDLGAMVQLWVPGLSAPSMNFSAMTIDLAVQAAFLKIADKLAILTQAGFRIDNSAQSAPDLTRLRLGDRISLGLSEFHAVLVGVGALYKINKISLLAEVTADILVGSDAPMAASPMGLDLGLRYRAASFLEFLFMAEVGLSKRPDIGPDDPLVPIKPRFSALLGASFIFGKKQDAGEADKGPQVVQQTPEPKKEEITPKVAKVSGVVTTEYGEPVRDALVRITYGDESKEVKTDDDGSYVFDEVPHGSATVLIEAADFDTIEKPIEVGPNMPSVETVSLKQQLSGSQIKGLIRSFGGKGIKAKVKIAPGDIEAESGADGTFVIDIQPGVYTVTVTANRYKRQSKKITVENNSVVILNMDLRSKKK